MKISVVIPAYNEEKLLPHCLDSLVAQKTKHQFEVIVVDNNSTDKTNQLAQSYKSKLDIRVILEKKKGRGVARATGFSGAKGEIFLSTDADSQVPENWIEKIVKPFSDKEIVAVTGPCQTEDLTFVKRWLFNFFQPFSMHLYNLVMRHYWLSGFNFAIRKEAYQAAGGFDTSLNAQEDVEIAFRVRKVGKIVYLNEPKVLFSARRFDEGFRIGFLQYLQTFFLFFFLKDKKIVLKDVRN